MAEITEVIVLGVFTIILILVLLAFANRTYCISRFETDEISVSEFVQKFNEKSIHFVVVEVFLSVLTLIYPIKSILLFLELFPMVIWDVYLMKTRRFQLDVIWAVRDMMKLKIQCVSKVLMMAAAMLTCIVKIML